MTKAVRLLSVVALMFLTVTACDNDGKRAPTDNSGQTDDTVTDTTLTDDTTDNTVPTDGDTVASCTEGTQECAGIWILTCTDGELVPTEECNDCGPLCNCTQTGDTASCTHVDPGDDIDAVQDDGTVETDDEMVQPDNDAPVSVDIYAPGPHSVLQKDLAKNASGNAMAVRIFYPADTGTYPYINFIHGFQLKDTYYDQILTQLASHGFVIVSTQFEQSLFGGDTTIEETTAMIAFIDSWIVPQLGANTSPAVPDFTKVGLAGHSRGGKTSWRMILANPTRFQAIAGVDPVLAPPPMGSDPNPISTPVSYSAPSLLIGTEIGPTGMQACAPADGNSAFMYPNLPSPTWHLIGGGIGHMDMIDTDDLSACGMTCSACSGGDNNQKATFRTLVGGLLVAFFRASLYGESDLYNKLTDTASMPHPITTAEHK